MSSNRPAGSTSSSNRRAQLRAEAIAAQKRARRQKMAITAAVVVVVAALIIGGLVWAQGRDQPAPVAGGALPPNITAAEDGIIVNPGKAEGKPLVELYFDYQCPGCGALERFAGADIVAGAEAGEYQLVYHTMTFLDTNLKNDSSVRAANAALCYAEVGDYAAYHQLIFDNQPAQEGAGYSDELLRNRLPAQLRTNGDRLTQFQTCYDEGKFMALAEQMNTEAARAGVTSTPTVRVDGKDMRVADLKSPDDFRPSVAALAASN